ncbi:MAG: type II toxin-antitoxin system PemK/MazF family toxin [Saprospiraceae bacterium]
MKWKIVLVPFPFDDLTGTKVRPAVCLTDEISTYRHVVIAFITSQVTKASEPSDIPLLTSSPDFSLTGLKAPSAIRLHRLVTIPTSLMQRQLGNLPVGLQNTVEQKLRALFGL